MNEVKDVSVTPDAPATNPIEARKKQWQEQLDQIRQQIGQLQQQLAQLQQQGIMLEGAIQACDVIASDSNPASVEAPKQ